MKRWEKAINHKWRAGTSHAFLLYLLVDDLILNGKNGGDKFETVLEFLITASVVGDAKFIATFNRGTGIQFKDEAMEEMFLKFLTFLRPQQNQAGENAAVAQFKLLRSNLAYALALFNDMLQISRNDERKSVRPALDEIFPENANREPGLPFFSVVLEYLETIAPQNAVTGPEIDRNTLVTFLAWAKNTKIAKAKNIFVLTAESLASIAPQLVAETSGIVPVKIHFPNDEDLEKTAIAAQEEYPGHENNVGTKTLVQSARGLSRKTLINLIKECSYKNIPITVDSVFSIKKKFLEERSGGHIELIEHPRGIDSIGGLEMYKDYVMKVVQAMRDGDVLAVPQGIILISAPGMGKTVLAEAIAHEAGVPFVRMKNIREMWVGNSERNQELVFELLDAMAPVIPFIDEIDQEYQSRSVMADNTGVNNRLQGGIFKFMSDTDRRGKILWIAASNRPDLLDAAMMREGRFSKRLALFPQNAEGRGKILIAILKNMERLAPKDKPFRYELSDGFAEKFGWLAHRHLKPGIGIERCDPDLHLPGGKETEDELPLSGGQIETIGQSAYELSGGYKHVVRDEHLLQALTNFIPGQDFLHHERMTDLALLYCNEESLIPEGKWRKRLKLLRAQGAPGTRLQT